MPFRVLDIFLSSLALIYKLLSTIPSYSLLVNTQKIFTLIKCILKFILILYDFIVYSISRITTDDFNKVVSRNVTTNIQKYFLKEKITQELYIKVINALAKSSINYYFN